ncbi:hypothetical protein C6569_01800 [Phreatobacter cathodiphilus]|uniref:Uncharacterized protein n=2 Tax=Phreatobacter cathodiphilus TaxID=1868589 RepID=A0A2S0N7I2_9HYPH|nr:hypothetical protein C6569_01800 [Phreatobacter cathodiphilus]
MPSDRNSKRYELPFTFDDSKGEEGLLDIYAYAYTGAQIEDIAVNFELHGRSIAEMVANIIELRSRPGYQDLA